MNVATKSASAVKQAVPFFLVSNIQKSLDFYVAGLGFEKTNQWIDDGKLRWCWLQHGGAALMLQEYRPEMRARLASRGKYLASVFQSTLPAKMPWPSTAKSLHAECTPSGHSSATRCGSRASPTRTATNSSSQVRRTWKKKPCTRSSYLIRSASASARRPTPNESATRLM